jgi:hypothetical protein
MEREMGTSDLHRIDLRIQCRACGKFHWKYLQITDHHIERAGDLIARLMGEAEEQVARKCVHLCALLVEQDPPEVRAIYDLELLAG